MVTVPTSDTGLPASDPRWTQLKRKANEEIAVRAVSYFRRNGIEPILIKGSACARYYPKGFLRDAMDVDLAVSIGDYARAVDLIRADRGARMIDLHRELRDLDTLGWHDLFENSLVVDFGDTPVRILRPEDHLRALSTHWLIDGGRYKHRLWDIYYIFDSQRESLDWHRLLDVVDDNRRRWIVCTIGAAAKYLDLDLSGTPLEGADRELPDWFVAAIEKEWTMPEFRALFHSTREPKVFWQQVRRRIPPNPITATVQMNGSLDARTRFFYYLGNIATRIGPSIRNFATALADSRK